MPINLIAADSSGAKLTCFELQWTRCKIGTDRSLCNCIYRIFFVVDGHLSAPIDINVKLN